MVLRIDDIVDDRVVLRVDVRQIDTLNALIVNDAEMLRMVDPVHMDPATNLATV
jgi:hypothetical protein